MQAEPRPGHVLGRDGSKIGLEREVFFGVGDAWSLVGDLDDAVVAVLACCHGDRAGGCVFFCVGEDNEQALPQPDRIAAQVDL